ncbi:MFS transporter [Secundilactobacillus yichangensis]|uniref:MFS transporter n=1 Tax=Secundilactobacillus yichangensis TaxID=2799580 RepID=UPI001941D574|nr:MFS transporter [Secundilactobacillus yichangensis]
MASSRSFWTKNFILLFGGNALLFMVYNMQVPVLPLYGKSLGMSASQIGLFVGTIMFAAMVVRLFSGRLLQYFKKKTLLLAAVSLYLIASVCYPLFTPFFILIMFRLLNGIGHGLGTTYFATAAADELPFNRLGEGMGYFGVSSMLTASLAPLIALPIAQKISFNAFFVTCIIILFIALSLLIFITPQSQPVVTKELPKIAGLWRKFLPQSLLIFCLGLVMSGVLSYIALFTEIRQVHGTAWFFFTSAIVGVALRPVVGNLFDQRGPFFVLLPSVICLICSLALMCTLHTQWQLILAGLFFGAADGAIFPTVQSWVLKKAGNTQRESATGLFLNCYDFGMGIGAYLLGKVIDLTSYAAMFQVLLGLTVLYLCLTLYYARQKV